MVEQKTTYNVNICFAYNKKTQASEYKNCEELVKKVVSDLVSQSRTSGKTEFSYVNEKINACDICEADFIIGDPAHNNFQLKHTDENMSLMRSVPAIILLSDDNWDKNVNSVLKNPLYDVRGIFRTSKLYSENKDADEFGNFVEVIKKLLRQFLRIKGLREEDFSKNISWKVKISDNCEMEFMSLFSTPAMQRMSAKYKDAILGLDDPFLRKMRGSFRPTNSLQERYREIRNFFSKNLVSNKNSFNVPSLLLLGETGCGKTLLANIASSFIMPDIPLTKINISSYNSESIDDLLFGSEKGSFTDSDKDRLGVFIGHCGEVVFLDEIGDMDVDIQTRLLTYMDNAQVLPRGVNEAVCAPCILIAATNKNVSDSTIFRRDILNRFNYVIEIPSLQERKQDIRLLISMILQDEKINPIIKNGLRKVQRISLDALNYLEEREYNGNFRELKFCLQQAVNSAFAEGCECICLRHFF